MSRGLIGLSLLVWVLPLTLLGASQDAGGVTGDYGALSPELPTADYLGLYESSGRPKFDFSADVERRFGDRLDQGVDPASLPEATRLKWQAIYGELRLAANRETATPRSLLLMDAQDADRWSRAYERVGAVSPDGAWSIAVGATAVRHGFAHTPCAEFMSELVREAYARAGHAATEDFNPQNGNPLIWTRTASVQGFSEALYRAGWIPWDTSKYRPLIGSLMMNEAGETPGHTFIVAGESGRWIVDNRSPEGLDLGSLDRWDLVTEGYRPGVFFLPPGINPSAWPSSG